MAKIPDHLIVSAKEKRRKARPSGVKEKRRFIRTSVAVPITIYLKTDKLAESIQTVTRNISATGIMVEIDEELSVGSMIKMEITPPDSSNPVHCAGKVVWSTPIENSAKYNSGIEFGKIEEDNKNTFLKFLCDTIYKSTDNG